MTLKEAIAYITKPGRNLQRVRGYVCAGHKKEHKYTFYSCVYFVCPEMYGFDTPEEVIKFAGEIDTLRRINNGQNC